MSDDLIRRRDAIKAIEELPNAYNGWSDTYDKAYIIGTLEEVPSADRPQGEWIEIDDVSISCRCSVCGWEAHLYEDDVYGMPYCPNCGAKMKGADDERSR